MNVPVIKPFAGAAIPPLKIAMATDAWYPQINGVVRTLGATVAELDRRGHEVELITPERFMTMPMPGYAAIRLAMAPRFSVRRMLDDFGPDIVHIATEGPIGWSARGWCKARGVPFTTAFHTRFPEYAALRTGISAERFWPIMARFHGASRGVLVATQSLAAELARRGIAHTRSWSRGIEGWLFRPDGPVLPAMADLPRPILLNVGRIAPEKGLAAFLDADVPGTKVVVGDGPALEDFRRRYPQVHFLGSLAGENLAAAYRSADCFVFPSRTDTFGLVVIEALACGLPVAAFPVPGPIDIVGPQGRGVGGRMPATIAALDNDLPQAIGRALRLDRCAAAVFGAGFTWERATDQFLAALTTALYQPQEAAVTAPPDRRMEPPAGAMVLHRQGWTGAPMSEHRQRKGIDMKRVMAMAGIAVAALSLSACAAGVYGGGGGGWGGPVAYDGWYDGAYGEVYDGYWGDDGYFYYRHGGNDHRYYRGDRNHFAHGDTAPGGNYHHMQGAIQSQPQGVRMPHFSGGGMHGDGHGGDHGH